MKSPSNKFSSQSKQLDSFELKGINIQNLKTISKIRNEPKFALDNRIRAFNHWLSMTEPKLSFNCNINYDEICPYSFPKLTQDNQKSIEQTFKNIGIDLEEKTRITNMAFDAVFDSQSVFTSHQEELMQRGIIFCSMKDAMIKYPHLIQKYMETVVPHHDNFYACLNRAFFSDGTLVYIPEGVTCEIPLSSYFRIDSLIVAQMEYTLIIADKYSSVTYLEGCSAPFNKTNQLHNAVVEIIAEPFSKVKYFTLQNWYTGDKDGVGGVYNLVTKRALVKEHASVEWFQIETGSIFTCKYPSCILLDNATGSFFSLTYGDRKMVIDSGTKMIHMGKNSKSTILSKSIVNDQSKNIFRGKIDIQQPGCLASSQCDTLILNSQSKSFTLPQFSNVKNSFINHEASTLLIEKDMIFFLNAKGLNEENAREIIVKGFSSFMLAVLPDEFLFEMEGLLSTRLKND